MRKIIKTAFFLLSIINIFLLSSCSKDFYIEEKKGVSKITKTSLDNLPLIKEAIELKINLNKATNKEADYLEYIDTEKVIVINDENNLKTYTFGLTISEVEKLTNVTIKETLDGLKYYLTKYSGSNYNQWIEEIKTLGYSMIMPEAEIMEMSKYNSDCTEVHIQMTCPSGIHTSLSDVDQCYYGFGDWTFNYYFIHFNCPGGATDSSSTGNNSGSGAIGGSGGGTPIITVPIPCSLCPPQTELNTNDPCSKLKDITSSQDILDRINSLKTRVNQTQEFAVGIQRKMDLNLDPPQFVNSVQNYVNGSNFTTNVSVGGLVIACGHNHPINGQSIPSWGDIFWLRDCEDRIRSQFFGQEYSANIVVVRDSQNPGNDPLIYAIKIENFAALQQQLTNDLAATDIASLPNIQNKIDALNDKMGEKFADVQNNTNGLEKKFLGLYSSYGIKLYKYDSNQDRWSVLKLQNPYNPSDPDAANTVISEPCNN